MFRPARSVLSFLVVIAALAVLWEVVKLLGGDPSEAWTPPFQWTVASDLNMPHLWDIAASFVEPAQRNGPPLGIVLVNAGFFTFREAFVDKFVADKFGEATTHWKKLNDRVHRGVGNPCPLVLIGLPDSIVTFHEGKKALDEVLREEDEGSNE